MAIAKLNPINKDDLKVGDVVEVAREVRCGWGISFRHGMVYPAKIIRITPKRTKIETDKFGEHDRYETFYKYDSEAIKESEMAKKFTEIITADSKEEIKRWRELAEEVSSCGKNG